METPSRAKIALAAVAAATAALGVYVIGSLPQKPAPAPRAVVEAAPSPQSAEPAPAAQPPSGGLAGRFLQALRPHAAPEPAPPTEPEESAKPQPLDETPAAQTAPPQTQTPVLADTPLPPRRPGDLAQAPTADVPLPPRRPGDLALLPRQNAPTPATTPSAAVAPTAPAAPAQPADQGRNSAVEQLAAHTAPSLVPPPAQETAPPAAPSRFAIGAPAYVRIFKKESELELWLKVNGRYSLYRTFPICKWSGRLGPKIQEADYQSPEGFYSVSAKQLHPQSKYHLAFNVGYPNAFDRQNGRTGGMVMVHGNCKSVGCFAMTDGGVDEIYRFVAGALAAGQHEVPVHIFPFRMTEAAIARETGEGVMAFLATDNGGARWGDFWRNLKEGYDLFQHTGEPPVAYACGDRYAFGARGASCQRIAGW